MASRRQHKSPRDAHSIIQRPAKPRVETECSSVRLCTGSCGKVMKFATGMFTSECHDNAQLLILLLASAMVNNDHRYTRFNLEVAYTCTSDCYSV